MQLVNGSLNEGTVEMCVDERWERLSNCSQVSEDVRYRVDSVQLMDVLTFCVHELFIQAQPVNGRNLVHQAAPKVSPTASMCMLPA